MALKQSEKKLLEGCLKKNRKAQKQLVKKYYSSMFSVCMRYCKRETEAEDILMEGFMIVLTKFENFRSEGSLHGWIKKIMINTAINHYRSNVKHYQQSDIKEMDDRVLDDNVFGQFSKNDILKTVQSLPEGYRMVFNLYAIEGYSHKEIAELLNVTESTSRTQLLKGRKLLQKKITELNKETILLSA